MCAPSSRARPPTPTFTSARRASRRILQGNDAGGRRGSKFPLRDVQIVLRLKIHPELRLDAEESPKAKSSIRRHRSPARADFIHAPLGNANGLGHPVTGQAQRLDEILEKNFPRMHRRQPPARMWVVAPMP